MDFLASDGMILWGLVLVVAGWPLYWSLLLFPQQHSQTEDAKKNQGFFSKSS